MKKKITKGVILFLCAHLILIPVTAGAAAGAQVQEPGTSQKDRISHEGGKRADKKGEKAVTPARTRVPSERIKADQAVAFPVDI